VEPGASSPSAGGGLSQGALIGIIVGVLGTIAVSAALGLLYFVWRKSRNQRPPAYSKRSGGCCGLLAKKEFQQAPPDPYAHQLAAPRIPLSNNDVKGGPGTYEMDGQWYRVEMAGDHDKFELDGEGTRVDRDMKDPSTREVSYLPSPQTPVKADSPTVYTNPHAPPVAQSQ